MRDLSVDLATPDDDLDELGAFMAQDTRTAQDAAEDAEQFYRLLRTLKQVRKDQGIKQRHVAEEMRTAQSAVSALENGRNDPQLSTLMRYARAVGARVVLTPTVEGQISDRGRARWANTAKAVPQPRLRRAHLVGPSDAASWGQHTKRASAS